MQMCVNRLKICLHRSKLIHLTCSAHSGRGLSTHMISFLQSGRKWEEKEQRRQMWQKKKRPLKWKKIFKLFSAQHNDPQEGP